MLQVQNKNNFGKSSPASIISLVLVLALVGVASIYRQNVLDWWALRGYTPPATIERFATQDTMTDYARKVFYVNRPEVNKKSSFTANCPNSKREQTIVLGCYHGNQSGIFLLEVSDKKLNGVEQVTAAHEMLHAAYDRLGSDEKSKVDDMLMSYYNTGLKDDRIKKTIDAYKKTEPNDLVNEMHSIFGTEVETLPKGLEDYYSKYFSSRKAVAAFSAKYQAQFTSLQDAVARYDSQLKTLKAQIESGKADLDRKEVEIQSERARLNDLRNNNRISEYNNGVAGYNALVDSYNSEIIQVRNMISQYNSMVQERNAIAVEQDNLVEELKGNHKAIQE